MPHKKHRGGEKKSYRERSGRVYPSKKIQCELRQAPKCKGVQNAHTAKEFGICNRCYQSKNARR